MTMETQNSPHLISASTVPCPLVWFFLPQSAAAAAAAAAADGKGRRQCHVAYNLVAVKLAS
jgi:hypothetical protein